MTKPFTIAELGSNPAPFTRPKLEMYLQQVRGAGADAVKVQLFKAEHFPPEEQASKKELEFPREHFEWFLDRARFYRLQVGASVFDKDAIDLCVRLGTDFIKLATREQSNWALREHSQTFKGTIFRSIDFRNRYTYPVGARYPREVTLGCIPQYPTPYNKMLADEMVDKLAWYLYPPWGWSSHTIGIGDVIVAASLGAKAIEKHFRIFDNDPEATWSLHIAQWTKMERILKYAA
jgi:sialic acid synthase SpsE